MMLVAQAWSAQNVVRFQVDNITGERAMVINLFLSELLTNFNMAADEGVLPDINEPEFISSKAWNNIKTSWETNYPFSCPEPVVIGSAEVSRAFPDEYEIRHIPLIMHNPNVDSYENSQEATVHLSKINGYFKITNFAISIEPEQYHEIIAMANDVNELNHLSLVLEYLERLRNAYCIKDLDFLEQIFSDDALIISGRVVTNKKAEGPRKQVEYDQFTKRQYLDNLAKVFKRNAHIDVTFNNITVEKHPIIEGIYGVKLFQGYRSSSYSDEGYLFLLWDFRGDQPQIHVRTWQDKRIWNIVPNAKKYGLSDFDVE